jgi:hypothetical protein
LIGGILIIGLIYLGFDLYSSYQTTLNYLDPSIKPLYLPSYAGIQEVIPLGMDRAEISSMFDSIPTVAPIDDLLSPATPMHMHGF